MGRPKETAARLTPKARAALSRAMRAVDHAEQRRRDVVRACVVAGASPSAIADHLAVARATVYNWLAASSPPAEARGRNGTEPTEAHGLENEDQP